nr:DNA-directed DNA polymerase [Tanacetum cinerariifolium]
NTLAQRSESSSSITSSSDTKITVLKAEMAEINKNLMRVLQVYQQVKVVTPNYETCGVPHSFFDCPATVGNTQNVYAVGAYQGNSYQPQGNYNLLSYHSDNYLGPPGFNQNQNQNNQNHNFQNQNRNQRNHHPQGNNQGRNQFFQGANQVQNQPPAYQAPAYQAPVYQAPVHQPQIPQPQVVTTNEFTNFKKANDAIRKNMQTNMTSLKDSNIELKNMFGQFMKMNTASSLGSGTLPGNTITNPKEDLNGITTQSGTTYPGPTIPTTSSSPVVECETEATKDMVHSTNNGSTEEIQPLVVLTESLTLKSEPVNSLIIKPVASPVSAPRPNQRPSILYPSRLQDQKPRDKANDQREIFFQIFKDLNFNISFADALILMPKFGPSIKILLTNKDKLYFDADPRVPLILRRSFLKILEYLYAKEAGDILLLEAFLNDDPSLPPPNQRNYMPEVRKELKICKAKSNKSSIDEPLEVELKNLPPHLEYAFLEGNDKLPVIIAKDLSMEEKTTLITVLKSHKRAITWKLFDIKGIDPEFCTHKILMEEDFKPAVQYQRRENPKIHDVIKQEVLKLLNAGLIYPIFDSPWVSPVHCVPKKLNEATRKDHFPLPFMDQMIERLAGNEYYCFLDGLLGYIQILIDLQDQEKTTFTCPYGTFAYRRIPFDLCNATGTVQRCMVAIIHDMIEKTMEVFMDDFSVFWNSFETCLSYWNKMLKRCEDTNLCLN